MNRALLSSRRLHLLSTRFSDAAVTLDQENPNSKQKQPNVEETLNKFNPETLVVPPPPTECIEKWNTLVGVNVVGPLITWAYFSISDVKILDIGSSTWLSDKKVVCPSVAMDMATLVVEKIPHADVYVFQKSLWMKGVSTIRTLSLNTIIFGSMIASQLNCRNQSDETENNVYFLEKNVHSNLFKLRVKHELISSQHVVRDMISKSGKAHNLRRTFDVSYREQILNPHYSIPSWSETTVERIWVMDDLLREQYCNSILLTLAFHDLICIRKPSALMAVANKAVKMRKKRPVRWQQPNDSITDLQGVV